MKEESVMFSDLKQFVPSEICLKCDGCCRFDGDKSIWRPKVGGNDRKGAVQIDDDGFLKTKLCQGQHVCAHFSLENNMCGIYHYRPFQCRLYPFMLTKKDEKHAVSVHLPCPHVEKSKDSQEYEEYVGYLKEYFKKEYNLKLFNENGHLFGEYADYEDEMETVFELNGIS